MEGGREGRMEGGRMEGERRGWVSPLVGGWGRSLDGGPANESPKGSSELTTIGGGGGDTPSGGC